MTKEQKARATDENPSRGQDDGGGGMNTGVAIVGFILCFLAGAASCGATTRTRHPKRGGIAADIERRRRVERRDSPVPISSKDPMWGKRDAPVTIVQFSRLPVPVLLARRADDRPGQDDVRPGQGPHRLEEQAAAVPPEREARRRGGRRASSRSQGSDAFWKFHDTAFKNQAALGPDSYDEVGAGRGREGHGEVQGRPRRAQVGRQGRQGQRAIGKAGVQRHAGVLHQRRVPLGRAAVRQVQGRHRPGARRRRRRRSRRARRRTRSTSRCRRRTRRTPRRRRRPRTQATKEDTTTVFKVPVGNSPVLGSTERARHHRRVLATSSARSAGASSRRSSRSATSTATRSASSGRTSRSRSTRAPSPRPRSRSKRAPRRATRASGTCTTSSSTRSRSSRTRTSTRSRPTLGLDVDKVEGRDQEPQVQEGRSTRDTDLGDDFQASGTPHFFINGRRLVGAQPVEKFEEIIDEEITKAHGAPRQGRPRRSEVYDALIKDGKGAARAGEEARCRRSRRTPRGAAT